MSNPIVLYKKRDFSQKMNVTIDYIRGNFKELIKPMLVIVIPSGILYSLIITNFMSQFTGMIGNPNISESQAMGTMSSIFTSYFLMLSLNVLIYSLILSVIFGYIKRKDASMSLEYMDIIKYGFRYFPSILGYSILTFVVSLPAMIFFFIPGLYLMITLSVGTPALVFEELSVGNAFSKSFKLIKNKWWSTFGLMIVTILIAGVISYIFILPTYAMMMVDMFSIVKESPNDPEAIFSVFSTWYASLTWALATIGQQLTYMIPIIALAFQYFNLSERLEGTGLKSQIEEFENLA